MPNAELSEILFILIMFAVVTIISTVSFFLFIRQYKREKAETEKAKADKSKTDKEQK